MGGKRSTVPKLPQLPDGCPPVLVRNTFLHVDVPQANLLEPIVLERSKSLPVGERRCMYVDSLVCDNEGDTEEDNPVDAGMRPLCPPLQVNDSSSDKDKDPDVQLDRASALLSRPGAHFTSQDVSKPDGHEDRRHQGQQRADPCTMAHALPVSAPMKPQPMRFGQPMVAPLVSAVQTIVTSGNMMVPVMDHQEQMITLAPASVQGGTACLATALAAPAALRKELVANTFPAVSLGPSSAGGFGGLHAKPQVPHAPEDSTELVVTQGQPAPSLSISRNLWLKSPQPQTLNHEFSASSNMHQIDWTVDARKLRGNDKQAVSPPFEIWLGHRFPKVAFKMMIYPKHVSDGKGGASFKKAQGCGFVQLKCETELTAGLAPVSFCITIGSNDKVASLRGPVIHDFSKSAVSGLPQDIDEWNLNSVVDQLSMTFVVRLELVPSVNG